MPIRHLRGGADGLAGHLSLGGLRPWALAEAQPGGACAPQRGANCTLRLAPSISKMRMEARAEKFLAPARERVSKQPVWLAETVQS
jgi:hypothetical protein